MKRWKLLSVFCVAVVAAGVIACGRLSVSDNAYNKFDFTQTVLRGMKEGRLVSLSMPDDWANWKDTWEDLKILYGISHTDKNMSSAEELQYFKKGVGDIGDVGYGYGKQAEKAGLTLACKTSYWDAIPDWGKDDNGDWIVCYTGTLAFLTNNSLVRIPPKRWKEMLKADYKVGISDVENASLGQYSVYAASIAMGGRNGDIEPGISFFKKLAQEGRLVYNIQTFDEFMKSGAGVQIKWDFVALQHRDMAGALKRPVKLSACIPSDGSVTIAYSSIINKRAQNPYAAMAAREYILSDSGQINIAKGYASPIRSVKLPAGLESRRISKTEYSPSDIKNGLNFSNETANEIVRRWNEEIMPLIAAQKKDRNGAKK